MNRGLNQDLGCAADCRHRDEEHAAFDRGVSDGSAGVDQHDCPYGEDDLREAWQTGHSVGALIRPATQAV